MEKLEYFLQNYSSFSNRARIYIHSTVESKNKNYPLLSLHYGNPDGPTLLFSGGVHGLERIGAQLTYSLLENFHQRLGWDETLQVMLQKIQIVFIPLVNPTGYFEGTRSNANGVDLMRNAPIDAEERTPWLLGGHRVSKWLPWYRGHAPEKESLFVFDTVKDILSRSNQLISLDAHSGFGFRDQLWFPFAGGSKPFSQLSELYLFFELFKKTHPYHVYKIEPQSKNYMTHGDLWDYCFLKLKKENQIFLPLTLEMGSWIWVKKNPIQLFSKSGLFNPIKKHRLNRTLRRHESLFYFLLHSLVSHTEWTAPHLQPQASELARKKFYES